MPPIVEAAHDAPTAGTAFVLETAEIASSSVPIGLGAAGYGITVLRAGPKIERIKGAD